MKNYINPTSIDIINKDKYKVVLGSWRPGHDNTKARNRVEYTDDMRTAFLMYLGYVHVLNKYGYCPWLCFIVLPNNESIRFLC